MPQAIITTSWDDGHPLDLRIAELLVHFNLAGTFYVPRKIETGVMSDSQLRDLSTRFEIGAHTLNHVFLTGTELATAEQEIVGSKKWVEDTTGRACRMFCPPAGRYSRKHLPIFARGGFEGIRSVEFFSLDQPRQRDGLLEMPTTLQAHPQSLPAYMRNMLKRRALRNFWLYTTAGHSRHWPTLARRLMDRAVATGGVFHLWGHAWEIEAASQWVELEAVLRQLGALVAAQQAKCLTNAEVCEVTRRGALPASVDAAAA
jgi:peptidoglycan/xylan/chitin deacetylase (PgdA/CDA1 family)